MTTDDPGTDPIVLQLARLPRHEPDRRRAEQVRARCQAALVRRRRRAERAESRVAFCWRRVVEPALAVGASVSFLFEVARRALELYGFWRS